MSILRNYLRSLLYRNRGLLDPTKNWSTTAQTLVDMYQQANKQIIDVGAGQQRLGAKVLTLDRFSGADITADAAEVPLKTASVDLALSIAVLEHLKYPQQAVEELYRVLKPNGEVYIEIPFLQPFHSSPHDYYRATLPGLKHWCRHFEEIDSGVCVGPGSAIAWILIEFFRLVFGWMPLIGLGVELLIRLLVWPLKYLDSWLIPLANSHQLASAIYFHGRKK